MGWAAGYLRLVKEMRMYALFSTYFPHMVVLSMLSFMLVLGGVSIEEALRERRR